MNTQSGNFASGPENNWLFSQFINYFEANEIFINVSHTFFNANDFVTLHRRNADDVLDTSTRTDRDTYQPFTGTLEGSRAVQSTGNRFETTMLSFVRPDPTTPGFYLGVQEQGISGAVTGIVVYYRIAPARIDGLLSCPELPLPRFGGMPVQSICSCAANSEPLDGVSLELSCDDGGSCSTDQSCACLPGYQVEDGGSNCEGTCECVCL